MKSYFQYKLADSFFKRKISCNSTSYNMYHECGYKLHDAVIKQNAILSSCVRYHTAIKVKGIRQNTEM